MTITRCMTLLACSAALALGACSDTKTVPDTMAVADANTRAAEAEDALKEAEASLKELRDLLTALGSSTPAGQQAVIERARDNLKTAQTTLEARPEGSPGKSEATEALTALGEALTAVDNLLGASASGASGPVALASMHATLARAQAAIDAAQVKLKAARAAAPAADTELRDLLTQAQAALSAAQVTLVPRLREELAQAESDAAERRGETTLGVPIAPERFARNILPVRSTGGGVTWTARTVLEVADGVTTMAVGDPNPNRLAIKDEAVLYETGKTLISANGNGNDEFQLRGLTVRGQLHVGPDLTGDLEFHGGIEGGTTSGTDNADLGVTADDGDWDRTDARMLSSIKLNEDGSGFTMKMGGDGVIFYDMERLTAYGPSQPSGAGSAWSNKARNGVCANDNVAIKCDDPTTSDIAAAFDNPAKDPDGEAAYHFSMVVPVNPATPITESREINAPGGTAVDKAPDWLAFSDSQGRRAYRVNPGYTGVVDLGDNGALGGTGDDADTTGYANLAGEEYTDPADGTKYKVAWLPAAFTVPNGATLLEPRRAGRIANGLPVDQLGVYTVKLSNYAGKKGTTSTDSYLQYAAYGLFNFLDYSGSPWFSRMQAFHFGYDAFGGANGEPKDFSTAETGTVTATFNGKTTGWVLQNPNGNAGNISQLVRLRGDVTLKAILGGGTSNGTISGSMENFEFLQSGAWSKLPRTVFGHKDTTTDGVTLMPADIGADGSYAGVAKKTEALNKRFGEGRYGGAFYGLRELGELETAGHWMLPRHIGDPSSLESCPTGRTGPSCVTFGSIIGSFGAVSEPE